MAEIETRRSTRIRLIEAAGRLFAEKGFTETTVKDITDDAGANVAAVNYYFRDKESLYEDVILHILAGMREDFPVDRGFDKALSPEARLQALVHNLLNRFLDPQRPSWQGILLAHERTAPRSAVLSVIHEEIEKTRRVLSSIVGDLLGGSAGSEEIGMCGDSLMGQIMSQAHIHSPQAPPVLRKEAATAQEIDRLARHITDFSLAGIRQIRRSAERRGSVP